MPAGEVQAGDIGQAVDSPKGSWNGGMLDHRVAGAPVDPHSIEEAENIIESYLMQAWLATLTFDDWYPSVDACEQSLCACSNPA